MITVKDLKKLLKKYPEDLQVVVSGYEEGYDDPSILIGSRLTEINPDRPSYRGKYKDSGFTKGCKVMKILIIGR